MAWICTTEKLIVFALDFQLYLCSVSSCICAGVDTTRSIIWSELLACRDVGRCPKLRSLVFHKSRRRASCDPVSISIWTNQPLVLQALQNWSNLTAEDQFLAPFSLFQSHSCKFTEFHFWVSQKPHQPHQTQVYPHHCGKFYTCTTLNTNTITNI